MEPAVARRRPDRWNRRMQQRLRERLHRIAVADAVGTLHRWCEAMLLAAGDPRRVIQLALRFRQFAVVILRRGQKVRLRLL